MHLLLSPFYLNSGYEIYLPLDVAITPQHVSNNITAAGRVQQLHNDIEKAKGMIKKAQETQKKYSDKKKKEETFKVGEKVLLTTENLPIKNKGLGESRTNKLIPYYYGPFSVIEVLSDV